MMAKSSKTATRPSRTAILPQAVVLSSSCLWSASVGRSQDRRSCDMAALTPAAERSSSESRSRAETPQLARPPSMRRPPSTHGSSPRTGVLLRSSHPVVACACAPPSASFYRDPGVLSMNQKTPTCAGVFVTIYRTYCSTDSMALGRSTY